MGWGHRLDGFLFKICKYQEKADRKQRKAFVMENGKILLENLIVSSSSGGKCNPIRGVSIEELKRATNNYNRENIMTFTSGFILYRGSLQDRQVSIMKYNDRVPSKLYSWLNNIVFASQMSHKNILKLIGCCLETQFPILVFEDVKYRTLDYYISARSFPSFEKPFPLLLSDRIKIAMEIANAVTYLHIGFSRPIVFRDISSSHILLDENHVPKLFNFSLCEFIPEGETHVRGAVVGTTGHVAPEYANTGDFNEKCDVYYFGAVLLEILTGHRYFDLIRPINLDLCCLRDQVKQQIENNTFNEMINPNVVGDESCLGKEQHLQAFAEIAFKCLANSAEDRLTMIEVAKQLRQIYKSS